MFALLEEFKLAAKISITSSQPSSADALVLGWFQEESEGKSKESTPVYLGKKSKDIDAIASRLKQSKHFSAKKNETDLLRYFPVQDFPNTLLVGLGSLKKVNSEVLRQAGAAVSLAQKKAKLGKISVVGESLLAKVAPADQPYYLQAFCEGYLMAGHEYKDLKKADKTSFEMQGMEIAGVKPGAEVNTQASILASAVNFARALGDRPGNFLTPAEFAKILEKMAKDQGLKCKVLGRSELQKEKMGLFIGVAQGSVEEPKLIILEHRGGKKTDKPIALVGKGVTFDTGGISLKPSAAMEDMKYDMMGAAVVAGIMHAIGALNLPLNVVGLIGATENMPGGRAQKPGDVARSMSGKSVEIINTDAEGRLVLADVIEYTQKYFQPQAMLDFATLTGAVVHALGSVTSGIMGTSPDLIGRMKDSAVHTGERVWELPLYEEYEEDLRSAVADIKNSGSREAGSSKGGIFIKFFVDSKIPWVHCDIAGSAYHRKDVNYHPAKYGAGVLIRLMAHLLQNWKPLPQAHS